MAGSCVANLLGFVHSLQFGEFDGNIYYLKVVHCLSTKESFATLWGKQIRGLHVGFPILNSSSESMVKTWAE